MSKSLLPYRQLRNIINTDKGGINSLLPYRQLRNKRVEWFTLRTTFTAV